MSDKPKRKASEAYLAKLKDPRWQKKRLQIFERDEFRCQGCGDTTSTLNVHHRYYERGADPWDYDDGVLVTLCDDCHEGEREWRSESEARLLATLREKVLAQELSWLTDMIEEAPADVLNALARSGPPHYRLHHLTPFMEWISAESEKFEAWERDYEQRQQATRGPQP